MPIKANCRACKKTFQFPDWFLGRIIDCPNCKSPLLILPPKRGDGTTIASTKVGGEGQAAGEAPTESHPSGQAAAAEAGPAPTTAEKGPSAPPPEPVREAPPARAVEAAAEAGGAEAAALRPAEASRSQETMAGVGSTDVSLVASGVAAVVLTAVFYVLFVLPLHSTYVGALFAHRGFVPYIIMLLTFWSLAILLLKYRRIARQKASLAVDVLPLDFVEEITPDNVMLFLEHIWALKAKWRTSFLVNRVQRALASFASGRSVQEVATLVSSQSDIDATAVLSSYKMVKVFIWAIPILGFIGTVLGIGQAVGGFSSAIEGAQNLELIKTSLGGVTSGLALAFDTTLVALVMSVLIMLPTSSLQTSEEGLLNGVDEFCNENLLRRLNESRETEPADGAQLVETLRSGFGELRAGLESGYRAGDGHGNIVEEIATAWGDVRQRLNKDNQQVIQQLQEMLRAMSAERRAFLEQVKSVQQDQVEQFSRALGQVMETTHGLQERIAVVQKEQVDGMHDVMSRLKQDLHALQKQAHDHNQASSTALEQVAGRVIESVGAVQERAEKLPETIAAGLATAMETIRGELAKVGSEATKVFQQQTGPLHATQQQIEASLKRSAAYMERVAESEASVRKLSQQQAQHSADTARQLVETLNASLLKIHQETAAAEANGMAEHQKRMDETSRRLQLVANLSAQRLETTITSSANLTEVMNRSHEKLAQQTRELADVIRGQQALAKTQELLAGSLAAVQSSGELLGTLSGTSKLLGELGPVLDRLVEQIDRLAAAQSADGPKRRGWFGWR